MVEDLRDVYGRRLRADSYVREISDLSERIYAYEGDGKLAGDEEFREGSVETILENMRSAQVSSLQALAASDLSQANSLPFLLE